MTAATMGCALSKEPPERGRGSRRRRRRRPVGAQRIDDDLIALLDGVVGHLGHGAVGEAGVNRGRLRRAVAQDPDGLRLRFVPAPPAAARASAEAPASAATTAGAPSSSGTASTE